MICKLIPMEWMLFLFVTFGASVGLQCLDFQLVQEYFFRLKKDNIKFFTLLSRGFQKNIKIWTVNGLRAIRVNISKEQKILRYYTADAIVCKCNIWIFKFYYSFVEYALCAFALCMELPFDGVFLKAEENNECFKKRTKFSPGVWKSPLSEFTSLSG